MESRGGRRLRGRSTGTDEMDGGDGSGGDEDGGVESNNEVQNCTDVEEDIEEDELSEDGFLCLDGFARPIWDEEDERRKVEDLSQDNVTEVLGGQWWGRKDSYWDRERFVILNPNKYKQPKDCDTALHRLKKKGGQTTSTDTIKEGKAVQDVDDQPDQHNVVHKTKYVDLTGDDEEIEVLQSVKRNIENRGKKRTKAMDLNEGFVTIHELTERISQYKPWTGKNDWGQGGNLARNNLWNGSLKGVKHNIRKVGDTNQMYVVDRLPQLALSNLITGYSDDSFLFQYHNNKGSICLNLDDSIWSEKEDDFKTKGYVKQVARTDVDFLMISSEERSIYCETIQRHNEQVLLDRPLHEIQDKEFWDGFSRKRSDERDDMIYTKATDGNNCWLYNRDIVPYEGSIDFTSRRGQYYFHMWSILDKCKEIAVCKKTIKKLKQRKNGSKKEVEKYKRFLDELEGDRATPECCMELGISPQRSTTINSNMSVAHDILLRVFAAFMETVHRKKADSAYSVEDGAGVADKWRMFPLVVETPDDGNVHQGIHFDSTGPSKKASFLPSMLGQLLDAEDSYNMGWTIHVPLCEQGMELRIMTPDPESKKMVISYVHIPCGAMGIVRLDKLHSGFYGGAGRKSLHAVVFPKNVTEPLDKLMYFEDFMTGGVFRKFDDEKHFGEKKEYIVDGKVYKYEGYRKDRKKNPDLDDQLVWASRLFEGWRVEWDERCTSAPSDMYHEPEKVKSDVFGGDGGEEGIPGGTYERRHEGAVYGETMRRMQDLSPMYRVLQKRIGMTAEEYLEDLKSRQMNMNTSDHRGKKKL